MLAPDYLKMAYEFALKESDDPDTKNGCVLVSGVNMHVLHGANRLPTGVKSTPDRLARPKKYDYMIHAEADTIARAAALGIKTRGMSLYCPWAACTKCAQLIIQSGIEKLVVHKEAMIWTPGRWVDNIVIAEQMLKEGGVEYIEWSGKIGVMGVMDGKAWNA